MRITKMHLDYWKAKKAPTPTWASDLDVVKHPRNAIHSLINCQGGSRDPRDPTFLKERTLNILNSVRRREGLSGLLSKLYSMADEPEARGSMCKRYLNRLAHQHIDHKKLSESLVSNMDGWDVSLIFAEQMDEPVQYKQGSWYFENLDQSFTQRSIRPLLHQALSKMSGYQLYELHSKYGS